MGKLAATAADLAGMFKGKKMYNVIKGMSERVSEFKCGFQTL